MVASVDSLPTRSPATAPEHRVSRAAATASAPASGVRGTTTPIGVCRKFEASVVYAARLPASNRTSPSTRSRNAASSAAGSIRGAGALLMTGSSRIFNCWRFCCVFLYESRGVARLPCLCAVVDR
ncbi:hypothetical protein G6048_13720 [Streptomyces sp. YC419]|uniref:Uncharacterized protein n=1 Tax=Streptomyces ureilyticus TaxID=1775131 RepID=A0ABX0DMS5_9ACTN|nr:hypothetical protein [Streptomyces ureilyticus]NGO43183.1 hypothetical protein [Streptomyces ureilyticus]